MRLVEDLSLKIAIVGRANVGKSTLFNKMAGGKFAIVKDIAGTTRDAKSYTTTFNGINITITDTAGLENIPRGSLPAFVRAITDRHDAQKEAQMYEQMIEKSLNAIKQAHITLFIVDGKSGISNDDMHFCKIAKRFCKTVLLLVNKCENERQISIPHEELIRFGLGEPFYISAEHKTGLINIYDEIIAFCNLPENIGKFEAPAEEEAFENEAAVEIIETEEQRKISLAIIGRPNAGKSSLINQIIGQDRLVTGDKPGITRDTIALNIMHKDQQIKIVDTAGVRKSLRANGDELERLSVDETYRVIRLANVVALVVDASDPFVTQDLHLAFKTCEEGRAIIVVMNKWDKLDKDGQIDTKNALEKVLSELINDVVNPCVVLTSATEGIGINKFLDEVVKVYENWNKRIKTPLLNSWLNDVSEIQRPKMVSGRPTKLKYITQIKTRPATFNLFVNRLEGVDRSYLRFLSKRMGKDFGLESVPIRIKPVKSKNKYDEKK